MNSVRVLRVKKWKKYPPHGLNPCELLTPSDLRKFGSCRSGGPLDTRDVFENIMRASTTTPSLGETAVPSFAWEIPDTIEQFGALASLFPPNMHFDSS